MCPAAIAHSSAAWRVFRTERESSPWGWMDGEYVSSRTTEADLVTYASSGRELTTNWGKVID